MLVGYIGALTSDAHLAEDLAQETLLTAGRIFSRLEQDANFGAWLRGIARNKVREHRRAAARRPLVVDSRIVEGMEEVLTAFDPSARGEESWGGNLEILRACIGKLKEGLRAAIESVYQRDQSLKEAGLELEASPVAVGQRLSRARNQIRKCVELQRQRNGDP